LAGPVVAEDQSGELSKPNRARSPLFAGNHDIGDKARSIMPELDVVAERVYERVGWLLGARAVQPLARTTVDKPATNTRISLNSDLSSKLPAFEPDGSAIVSNISRFPSFSTPAER
jgi:hypothetical protein